MDLLNIKQVYLNFKFTYVIKYFRYISVIFMMGLPFLSLCYDTKKILILFFLTFIFELFYGTRLTNYIFLFMSVLYSRFFMYPLNPEGEIWFYVNQFTSSNESNLISHLAPIAFWFLSYINIFFKDPISTIDFFRIFVAFIVMLLLYNLIEKITNNRRLLFIIVFSFMFWHTQIIGFEQDELKNFLAQIFFLLFLDSSIKNSKKRYIYFGLMFFTHLSYSIVAFIILLFHNSIYNNKIKYIKFSIFVWLIFILLLFIIPHLNIHLLSISQRVADYMNYSKILFKNQLEAKGGYLFTEILSTNAISTYLMLYLLLRYKYFLNNIIFRFLFIAWLIPYLISKLYLINLPFLVDRFIMLYHGFWIIVFLMLANNLVVKETKFKILRFLFGLYLFLVTFIILIREQKNQFERILNADFTIFANHYGVLLFFYIFIFCLIFIKYIKIYRRSLL
jgi:hypothetical protein